MTIAHEDAREVDALAPAERSAVAGIRGLRWWVVVLAAFVLAVGGVAGDLLQAGELGIFYTVAFPAGALLAAVWVRRGEMFATCVQPPLLLAVSVPVAIAATGSLPRAGGLTAVVLAVGGPMINGFPVMAITTAVCLAIAFARSRLQPLTTVPDERDAVRPDGDRPERDRPARVERERMARDRPDRDRPDDRRRDDRRPDDRRGEPGRPAKPPQARPADPARRPARRPAEADGRPPGERAGEERGEGFGPGVYRVPRPPQTSRPAGRPDPDAPRRPKRPGRPPENG